LWQITQIITPSLGAGRPWARQLAAIEALLPATAPRL
jgi:hypothetical protein